MLSSSDCTTDQDDHFRAAWDADSTVSYSAQFIDRPKDWQLSRKNLPPTQLMIECGRGTASIVIQKKYIRLC